MPFPPERRKSDTNGTEKVPVTGVLPYFLRAFVDIVSFPTCFMPTWETFKIQLLCQWLHFGTPPYTVLYFVSLTLASARFTLVFSLAT